LDTHSRFKEETPDFVKLYHARVANLEAAIRCNHKRTPPKTWDTSLDKKQERLTELKTRKPKTEKQGLRLDQRIQKLKLDIDLQKRTKDYNLNTSLRNYIDPSVYKKWSRKTGFDWTRVYSKTLQRKFQWAINPASETSTSKQVVNELMTTTSSSGSESLNMATVSVQNISRSSSSR
jgi:hypothetical protein